MKGKEKENSGGKDAELTGTFNKISIYLQPRISTIQKQKRYGIRSK
jgi:hypothetical protein